ncbi:protein kinase, putative [Trypanosoma equiperdum]|uniref:Protein kinase, putative n=3 Tax=Trypanozoon TaxID=39700 RepID=C9ZQL9_TRYB9|nr:protein kinase, putative [Trypanosoma brucei gambiense DAL972]RHW71790.1 protein kinase [Trypanosoma brucei equiperdum]CBH11699.1 protein kinase, putative [Trypanosoma brucei gambiense DAL972]SCU72698.1 protein kinase, putative [Trypanosoma equiperdum]|eukprot:XP_011773984.1 protein kinase, putative [Trypanosoma brucei gambiense DAL972]
MSLLENCHPCAPPEDGHRPLAAEALRRRDLISVNARLAGTGVYTSRLHTGAVTPRPIVRTVKALQRPNQLVQLDRTPSNTLSAVTSVTAFSEEVDDVASEMASGVLEASQEALDSWLGELTKDVPTQILENTPEGDKASCSRSNSTSGDPSCSASLLSSTLEFTKVLEMESVATCSTTCIGDGRASVASTNQLNGVTGTSAVDVTGNSINLLDRSASPALRTPGVSTTTETALRRKIVNVRIEERIGRGMFGDVFRATDLDTGAELAVKQIIVSSDIDRDTEKQLCALEREIRVMRKLNHKHIVKYFSSRRDEGCCALLIYMEYISGGTIASKLKTEGALSEEETRNYTRQLLEGLAYLHKRRIVHRDLKGDNLFITGNGVLKVGDFGTSKDLQSTIVTNSVAGTPNFMAPEVINCSGHSYTADIWSVGCCVLEMLTGHPPFWQLDNCMAVMFAILRGELERHIPEHLPEGAKEFIRQCTRTNPKERLTARQLLRHPWIKGKGKADSVRSCSLMDCSLASACSQIDVASVTNKVAAATTSPINGAERSRVSLLSTHIPSGHAVIGMRGCGSLLGIESGRRPRMNSFRQSNVRRRLSISCSSSTAPLDSRTSDPRKGRRKGVGIAGDACARTTKLPIVSR